VADLYPLEPRLQSKFVATCGARRQIAFARGTSGLDLFVITLKWWGSVFTWDEAKRRRNIAERGIDFAEVERFDLDNAYVFVDAREDYGELREVAFGFIGERLHVLVFTRRGADVHVISLRKANRREVRRHDEHT
jgi:uncharacterized DUF497 family protein